MIRKIFSLRITLSCCVVISFLVLLYFLHFFQIYYKLIMSDDNSDVTRAFFTLCSNAGDPDLPHWIVIPIAILLFILDLCLFTLPGIFGALASLPVSLVVNCILLIAQIWTKTKFVSFNAVASCFAIGFMVGLWIFLLWCLMYYAFYPAGRKIVRSFAASMIEAGWIDMEKKAAKGKEREERRREQEEEQRKEEFEEQYSTYDKEIANEQQKLEDISLMYPDVKRVPEVAICLTSDLKPRGFWKGFIESVQYERMAKLIVQKQMVLVEVINTLQTIGRLRMAQAELVEIYHEAKIREQVAVAKYDIITKDGGIKRRALSDIKAQDLEDAERIAQEERNAELSRIQHETAMLEEKRKQAAIQRLFDAINQPEEKKDEIRAAVDDLKRFVMSEEDARMEITIELAKKDYTKEQIEEVLDRFDRELSEQGYKRSGRF